MKYTREIIIIIICTILLSSEYLNAQTGTTGTTTEVAPLLPRYTGLCVDYRANDSFMRVMNMFTEAGYSLELDGTTQSVRIDVVNFYDSYLPNSAAAVAMGLDNDNAVRLPSEESGMVMVFNSFDDISYAYVLSSELPLNVGDQLLPPPYL